MIYRNDLYLNAVATMIPFWLAADQTHYARWGCVYLADIRKLSLTAPTVHDKFLKGDHHIKRSNRK